MVCVVYQQKAMRQLCEILRCRRHRKLRAVNQSLEAKVFPIWPKQFDGWPEPELWIFRLKLLKLLLAQATLDYHGQQVAKLLNKALQLDALHAYSPLRGFRGS
jgi:hypothetical protein